MIGAGANGSGGFVGCIALPAMATSVQTARMHTRDLMEKWDLMSIVDDAELVVSELVTNAVKATNAIPPNARYPELYDRLEVICLCLYADGADVLIEIWDPKPELPAPRRGTLDEEGGRGLWLVASLCRSWGTRHPSTGGKTVWARLSTTPPTPPDPHDPT